MNKKKLEQIFFPYHCPICDRALLPGEEICGDCKSIPQIVAPPRCQKCGKHIENTDSVFCYDCLRTPRTYERGFSLYEYSSVHDSVSTFKNLGRPEYGEYYGRQMGLYFCDELAKIRAQALIPIPLHPAKEKQRGYNQALILARGVSEVTDIPVAEGILIRPDKTKVQKDLDRFGRQNNMKKAFHIAKNDVKLKTVVLVDDITTTGSTILAATEVLLDAGVENVYFITLAAGRGY